VQGQEIRMDTPHFSLSYISLGEMNLKEVSQSGMFMWWYTFMWKVTISIGKQNVDAVYDIL
jgi:hypothetical protein